MATTSPDDGSGPGLELGNKPSTPNAQHTRTYQACIPCRRRKVRCDLGPVDNPHEPPCVRCRREAKECFFSSTRRKKRAADSGAGPEDVEPDDYEVRGGRKRLKDGSFDTGSDRAGSYDTAAATATAAVGVRSESPGYLSHPLTPGGSMGRRQPLRRPAIPLNAFGESSENEDQINSHTAAILQTAELHHGHDALNVLLAAAQHHPDSHPDSKPPPSYAGSSTTPASARHASLEMGKKQHVRQPTSHNIDPNITPPDENENAAAIRAWSRFRFVRSGWLTAREGMAYVEYFYSYLSPLTPISLPDYRHPANHVDLLENEPLLAVTILMLASRYAPLGDSTGRAYTLHQRLWIYTQSMIDRLLWGRELPGVYTSSLQGEAGCDVNPLAQKGLLTLGSVESLMLLTEWHSRHVHFPEDDDDAHLMAPETPIVDFSAAARKDLGTKSVSSWIEPCYRSDRMCWNLLNMAKSIAIEIGVFERDISRHVKLMPRERGEIYEQRRLHVRSLLLVYITQTSGRMGIVAMLPEGYAEPDMSELFAPTREVLKDVRDYVIHFWLQLARLLRMANDEMYANRQYTRDIIRDGRYKALLKKMNPMLAKWRLDVEAYRNDFPPQMFHIMMIEFEHCRVCVTQLALQAVVERCINNNIDGELGKAIPPDRLNQWYGDDRENVAMLIDACRNVLRIVVDGLAPGGFLKHAPVRTSFRMISVAMVLVKTFAFGANAKEVSVSLNLMHRTVTALRENVVDDVHIANGFAHHIALLVERIPKALKRFPGQSNSRRVSTARGFSQSPAPQTIYTSSHTVENSNAHHMRDSNASDQPWTFANQDHSTSTIDNYDFNDNGDAFMLMPPPTNAQLQGHDSMSGNGDYGASYQTGGGYANNNNGYTAFGSDGFSDQGWVALPLDNIFGGQNVQVTGFGPRIDGDDMLEVLLGNINT